MSINLSNYFFFWWICSAASLYDVEDVVHYIHTTQSYCLHTPDLVVTVTKHALGIGKLHERLWKMLEVRDKFLADIPYYFLLWTTWTVSLTVAFLDITTLVNCIPPSMANLKLNVTASHYCVEIHVTITTKLSMGDTYLWRKEEILRVVFFTHRLYNQFKHFSLIHLIHTLKKWTSVLFYYNK